VVILWCFMFCFVFEVFGVLIWLCGCVCGVYLLVAVFFFCLCVV